MTNRHRTGKRTGYRLEATILGESLGSPLYDWSSVSFLGSDLDAALLRISAERKKFEGSNVRFRLVDTDGSVVEERR